MDGDIIGSKVGDVYKKAIPLPRHNPRPGKFPIHRDYAPRVA